MTHGTARANITLMIDDERCMICDSCAAGQICRIRAIRTIDAGEPPYLDQTRCLGCRVCISVCPHGAVVEYRTG